MTHLSEWGIGQWTALALIGLFLLYLVFPVKYMLQIGKVTWFYMFQAVASVWLAFSIALNFMVSLGALNQTAPGLFELLMPGTDLIKGSAAMLVVGVWAWISAVRIQELGVGSSWRLARVLERSWPVFLVFFVFFVGAGVVAYFPVPFIWGDLETTEAAPRAIAFRYLVALPVSVYAAMMVIAIVRFSISTVGRQTQVRRRLEYFAVTWGCCCLWGFLWAGWFVEIGTGSLVGSVVVLTIGCVSGLFAMKPASAPSDTDLEIQKFSADLEAYTKNRYNVEGFSSVHQVDAWQGMEDLLGRFRGFLGNDFITEAQLKAGLNAIWFLDQPEDKQAAEGTHVFHESTVTSEFRPSIYGIPEECSFKDEIEEEIEIHNRACWAADILSLPNLTQRIESEQYWVQILAIVTAYGGVLEQEEIEQILDTENPRVHPAIMEYYRFICYSDSKR
jgi:hypothetical protein